MLIEVSDCQMTYRARYLDDLQQNGVLDLCVTDATSPRSILSQLEAIADHVDVLPTHVIDPLRNDEKRLAMAALHQVRMLTSDDLGNPHPKHLTNVLSDVERMMKELARLLERKYLLHSGEPRQLFDDVRTIT